MVFIGGPIGGLDFNLSEHTIPLYYRVLKHQSNGLKTPVSCALLSAPQKKLILPLQLTSKALKYAVFFRAAF